MQDIKTHEEHLLRIKEEKVYAEYGSDITLWLQLDERKGLLSLVGESRISSMFSSADSGLQQQVDFTHKKEYN